MLLANINSSFASGYHYKQQGYNKTQTKQSYSDNKSSINKNTSYKKHTNTTNQYAQNKQRSRSDVMSEVKRRYNAKVLKISYNEKAGVYNVRMLMPSGKVRSIQVVDK